MSVATGFNNFFLKTSNFPVELKCANQIPVPEVGDHLTKSNYRPIHTLPAVSKVIERIYI